MFIKMINEEVIQKVAGLLSSAHYAIVLTGAGISTPSGVPDFRSHGSGLWEKVNPFEVASIQGFRYRPQSFYEWIHPLAKLMQHAQPNPAHYAIARLEAMGVIKAVITQNIDMLHARAGSKTYYEVHGHIREFTCIECMRVFPSEPILEALLNEESVKVPRCAVCNGILKPNVILFNEQLPIQVLLKAEQAARQADVLLVVGSSLEVYPVADIPYRIKANGGKVILLNLDPTVFDPQADLVIHGDCAEVLPRIVHSLEGV